MLKKSRFCDLANCKNTALLTCGKTVAGIKRYLFFNGIPAPPKTSFRRSNPIFSTWFYDSKRRITKIRRFFIDIIIVIGPYSMQAEIWAKRFCR